MMIVVFLAAFLTLFQGDLAQVVRNDRQDQNWWTHTTIYQIYPRSYQDSDGDGTGDIKGIQSRLDYLENLGIETVWLSPIYKSPMADFGYDISNFTDIDPIFGNLNDFFDLINDMHSRGMKLVMDFVPNHSSDEHEWFKKSVNREDPFTDYYVWLDPKGFDSDGNPIPPNNWISVFLGSMWEFNEQRGQFYLHQFTKDQPDLNYRNPLVREEMNNVLRVWLDRGVDGFRFDAIAHIWEDDRYLDEPPNNYTDIDDPNDYNYWDHIYTYNLPETRDVLKEMYETIKSYTELDGYDRVEMLEIYASMEDLLKYFDCSDYPFNFGLINLSRNPTKAEDVARVIDEWVVSIPDRIGINWVLGNHDSWRVGTRFGKDLIDPMNMIMLTLPGVAVTYQGEEIGMLNNFDISWEETVDVSGCKCGPEDYNNEGCSRDPERTPMQWNAESNAGFCPSNVEPWLPINENYLTVNVEAESNAQESHLEIYKQLPTMEVGNTMTYQEGQILAIGRYQDQTFYKSFFTLVNFGDVEATIDIDGLINPDLHQGITLISSLLNDTPINSQGSIVELAKITMKPKEAIVIQLT